MKKEHCTKFCGVFINSHEVMKLQSSELGVSDIILANVLNILPFYTEPFTQFYGYFDHFS